jgi:hypothetical protein
VVWRDVLQRRRSFAVVWRDVLQRRRFLNKSVQSLFNNYMSAANLFSSFFSP